MTKVLSSLLMIAVLSFAGTAQAGSVMQKPATPPPVHAEFLKIQDNVLKNTNLPNSGPEGTKVVLVQFYDYLCSYCLKSETAIQTVLTQKKTTNIRQIYIPLGLLGKASEEASSGAYAAFKMGKFDDYHKEMMSSKTRPNHELLLEIAKKIKLDPQKFEALAYSKEAHEWVSQNNEMFKSLKLRTVPSYFINGVSYPNSFTPTSFSEALDEGLKR